MVGYIRDVVTQLKRGLDGFVGPLTSCESVSPWSRHGGSSSLTRGTVLHDLVRVLVGSVEHAALLSFIDGPDVAGLDESNPHYLRAVLASELGVSPVIANDDPEEVRYNVFQALQYLADWLRGNGCVALPAKLKLGQKPVFVRVMDDLATTERSRWEVWAEIAHGRVSMALFEQILAEEVAFIQAVRRRPANRGGGRGCAGTAAIELLRT